MMLCAGSDADNDWLRRREGILEFFETTILLDVFFHHAAGDEVLKLFIRPEAQHLLPAAHGIPKFEALVNCFKEAIKIVGLRLKKSSY